jgi:hypothetical protein
MRMRKKMKNLAVSVLCVKPSFYSFFPTGSDEVWASVVS